ARRAPQQDVRLGELDIGIVVRARVDALVVPVDSDRQDRLGVLLADHVVIEEGGDLLGLGQFVELDLRRFGQLLFDDVVAEVDALVADVDAWSGDQLLDLLLRLATEAALDEVARLPELCHRPPSRIYATPAAWGRLASSRVVMTSSMMP